MTTISDESITHTGLWDRIVSVFFSEAKRGKVEYVDLRPTQIAELLKEDNKRISDAMRQMSDRQILARVEITTFNGKSTASKERYLYRLSGVKERSVFKPLKTAFAGRPIVRRDRIKPALATVHRSVYDAPLETPVPVLWESENIEVLRSPNPATEEVEHLAERRCSDLE